KHGTESAGTLFVPSNNVGISGSVVPHEFVVGNPSPSPMRSRMTVSLGLPRRMTLSVDVLDAQGRIVRALLDGMAEAGWLNVGWHARNAAGRPAAAGLSFVRVRAEAGERIRRLVVLP